MPGREGTTMGRCARVHVCVCSHAVPPGRGGVSPALLTPHPQCLQQGWTQNKSCLLNE